MKDNLKFNLFFREEIKGRKKAGFVKQITWLFFEILSFKVCFKSLISEHIVCVSSLFVTL